VWLVRFERAAPALSRLEAVLSDAERERASRFRFEAHRARFITRRGALRELLASYAGAVPRSIRFGHASHGKPFLDPPSVTEDVRFNASASGDVGIVAVTVAREIGVDIEAEREITDAPDIVRRFFTARERSEIESLPESERNRAFLACWTRKEAYVKAVGLGLSMALSDFDVTVLPDEPATLRASAHGDAGRWTMREVAVPAGYLGAIVVEGAIDEVRVLDWSPAAAS
jgi:4'-phosphopantetheinyl transferase